MKVETYNSAVVIQTKIDKIDQRIDKLLKTNSIAIYSDDVQVEVIDVESKDTHQFKSLAMKFVSDCIASLRFDKAALEIEFSKL